MNFGNNYVAAGVLHEGKFTDVCSFTFDKMTNQQIARKFIQLFAIGDLHMKLEESL
ncbi:hypothetical protein JCM19239_2139 [Vibrio variabilis]|uniref:Uncharacterized protein n=1 Tax=Vibrio variabilis TaxID=990271 RepID=A0ABQ0JJF7_9VIBR|nr:hypothetical protein JCM19239_2139 [Vibrio variabilis]